MGTAYLELEKYEAARTSLRMAIELNPDLKEAIVICTTCEVLIGDAGKTIPTLEGLLKKGPEYPMALAILAAVYCVEGARRKGLKHIKRLTKMGFECADYLHDLSERPVSTGKTDRAVSLLESGVEICVEYFRFR
jgi:tetratricopeptide (TPR) repeat protein